MSGDRFSSIFWGVDRSTLFDGPDWGDIDEEASFAAYCAALTERLQQAFPGVRIEVFKGHQAKSCAFRATGDSSTPADCTRPWYEHITDIEERLFAEPDVWVRTAAETS